MASIHTFKHREGWFFPISLQFPRFKSFYHTHTCCRFPHIFSLCWMMHYITGQVKINISVEGESVGSVTIKPYNDAPIGTERFLALAQRRSGGYRLSKVDGTSDVSRISPNPDKFAWGPTTIMLCKPYICSDKYCWIQCINVIYGLQQIAVLVSVFLCHDV